MREKELPPLGAIISVGESARRLLVVDVIPDMAVFKTIWLTHAGVIGPVSGTAPTTRGMQVKENPNHQTWNVDFTYAHSTFVDSRSIKIHGQAEIKKVQHVSYYVRGMRGV